MVVGAQVSYPDLVGFGRREMDLAPEDVTADVLYQVGALAGIARAAGTGGARTSSRTARSTTGWRATRSPRGRWPRRCSGTTRRCRCCCWPARPGWPWSGTAGLTGVGECFADRGYTPDGGLLPRGEPGAVLTDPAEVAIRAVRMATGEVVAADGSLLRLDARSMCLHGDTPGAAALARAVRDGLLAAGVELAPFG